MGLIYNSAALEMLQSAICSLKGQVMSSLADVHKTVSSFADTKSIQGDRWNNISDYLKTFHGGTIIPAFFEVANFLETAVRDYYGKFLDIDINEEAIINVDELISIITSIPAPTADLENSGENLHIISDSISDISRTHINRVSFSVLDTLTKLSTFLDQLINRLDGAEASANGAIQELKNALSKINSLLSSNLAGSPENFSRSGYLSSKDYGEFYTAFTSLEQTMTIYEANREHTENLIGTVEQAWQERAEKAKRIKTALAIFGTVVAVGAAVLIPGAGAVAVCAIAGGVSGVVSETTDQWSGRRCKRWH